MEVIAEGHLEYYAPFGKLSLILTGLERIGEGSLHEQFEAMRRSLQEKGWFHDVHKLPLPSFPRRIAILTSEAGAVRHDIEHTAHMLWPSVSLVLIPIPVQGEHAPKAIARAIRATHASAKVLGFEAAILARGGGSLEDLWAFNTMPVLEALFETRQVGSRLPFVAAIGHESDTTLAELVADYRASTPTAAATALVPSAQHEREMITAEHARLLRVVLQQTSRARERINHLFSHVSEQRGVALLAPFRERLLRISGRLRDAASPKAALRERSSLIAQHARRLVQAERVRVDRAAATLEAHRTHLAAIGPECVLGRGYSLTTDANGRIIRRAEDVAPGETIATRVADGTLRSKVLSPEGEGE